MTLCLPFPPLKQCHSPHLLPSIPHSDIGANHLCLVDPHTTMTMDAIEDSTLCAICEHRTGQKQMFSSGGDDDEEQANDDDGKQEDGPGMMQM